MAAQWETLANDPDIKPLLVREVDGREMSRTYLRHVERSSEAAEVEAVERKLADPVERRFLQNPGKLKQQNDRRKQNLVAQSPPTDLRAAQRDKLAKLEAATRDFVAENMPTAEQMRHNPPGAVDHHIAWDRHTKRAMLTWKNCRLLLNPHSDAGDLANFERYRPANSATRNLFTDGQIPGQFALSPQAKANYDQINWSDPEVLQEAARHGLVKNGAAHPRTKKPGKKSGRAPMAVTATCGLGTCPVEYRGPLGPLNLKRHRASTHGVREEVSA